MLQAIKMARCSSGLIVMDGGLLHVSKLEQCFVWLGIGLTFNVPESRCFDLNTQQIIKGPLVVVTCQS